MTDVRVGFAELELLAEILAPPCELATNAEGLVCQTSTALIFVARGVCSAVTWAS